MTKRKLYLFYIINTLPIWILFITCIYCILACEFESLKIPINQDLEYCEKLNNIVKNLSYSYIAGVIFFLLSDSIPFLRKGNIAYKNINKAMHLIITAIDNFSKSINGKTWENTTSTIEIYEEISGGEYAANTGYNIPIDLPEYRIAIFKDLYLALNLNIDFIISQEQYIDTKLLNDFESIRSDDCFLYIGSIANKTSIEAENAIMIFEYIKKVRNIIFKYIQTC